MNLLLSEEVYYVFKDLLVPDCVPSVGGQGAGLAGRVLSPYT